MCLFLIESKSFAKDIIVNIQWYKENINYARTKCICFCNNTMFDALNVELKENFKACFHMCAKIYNNILN
jgi:hypothetical protein